ncbi:30S ribosomal protein S4 [Candidatus Giovannonibacteria bacterium RIFCSPHIGHO2_02_FULL_46_20]|uniref:Small ribosomal subunit protein uS4 n=1 Tax=Candidatus Giovannonibacteria bacterium RIFCSPHIGHO2_02_FULL_46_20 TaxID=1798338 RepID=A0A1F5WD85_9BACT|nr:MAG: 30S ribosomal protein S4 [Candidatus Giovannonibacteria bacterium RIFCSPHIGHO2_02_FULL_46_20]
MRVVTTCKACRRLGVSVCGREKCAVRRKPYPPGIHGKSFRRGLSEYGTQLREKQKIRLTYGLRERQFQNLVTSAFAQKSISSPDAVLRLLEMRLDNVTYRLGLAPTRAAARQLVNHGHLFINSRRVNIPSYRVNVGDEIKIRPQSVQKGAFANLEITLKKHSVPSWLAFDMQRMTGKVVSYPPAETLEELGKGFTISAVIEYYSR